MNSWQEKTYFPKPIASCSGHEALLGLLITVANSNCIFKKSFLIRYTQR